MSDSPAVVVERLAEAYGPRSLVRSPAWTVAITVVSVPPAVRRYRRLP